VSGPRDDEPTDDERQAEHRPPKKEQSDEGDEVGNMMHIPVSAIAVRLLVVAEKCCCVHCAINTRSSGGLTLSSLPVDAMHFEANPQRSPVHPLQ
jgi:hypothetical protein